MDGWLGMKEQKRSDLKIENSSLRSHRSVLLLMLMLLDASVGERGSLEGALKHLFSPLTLYAHRHGS